MGVQKSRKSIKFTKYSLSKQHKITALFFKKNLTTIYLKHVFKKTNIFLLKRRETNATLFFTNI